MRDKKMIKLVILLTILFTIYAPIELTRIILINGWTIWPDSHNVFVLEIAFIWAAYITAIWLVASILKYYNKGA